MQRKSIKRLIFENLIVLLPFLFYAIYKNGYLVYIKKLIALPMIFKPIYLVLISLFIKVAVDLVKTKKIIINFDLLYVVLIAMIMPCNINLITYSITFLISYILLSFLDKYIKLNKVCLIYLIIILFNSLTTGFTYLNPLEAKFNFSFTFLDLLIGRNVGGISTTSIIFSLIAFYYLTFNFYYKKNIPIAINFTYLALAFIYFIFTSNSEFILNSELIFASIFICTLPKYSPFKIANQIVYGIFIGILTFIIAICFNSILAVYLATFIVSIINNIDLKKIINK